MKHRNLVIFGIATFGALSVGSIIMSSIQRDKLNNLLESMDKISEGMNCDVPEKIVNKAMMDAANKATKAQADKAMELVKKTITNEISNSVDQAMKELTPTLKEKVEKEITLTDISNIKKEVIKDAAATIVKNLSIPTLFDNNYSTSTAGIIKQCADAGMSSYEIERLLKAVK